MEDAPQATTFPPPETWLDGHGDALFRYAYLRLGDRSEAEDLVQDTLLAALAACHRFTGRSSERTWLIGILKHKLADYWRCRARSAPLAPPTDPDSPETDELLETLFAVEGGGHWRMSPAAWPDPDAALEQKEFWRVLTDCIAQLPPRQANAFCLRELDGLEAEEMCKVLGAAPTNVWVLLHRARLRLGQCLEHRWFGRETGR